MQRSAGRVLLIELNEITWTLAEPLIAAGELPNFARLRAQGAWGTTIAPERPPHLDPWITWVTLHSGVEREVHGAAVLEQGAETIRAARIWDYAAAAGRSVGVFGSVSCYPPRPLPGFVVPGPFAPGVETFPPYLEPAQRLNQTYTKLHNRVGTASSPVELARNVLALLPLGLRPQTLLKAAGQLARERLQPDQRWRRVALQPYVNYDIFAALYRRYAPDLATWHSNHVAHYQHHYWKAHDDRGFPTPVSDEERRRFGDAVRHGYRVADELLGRFVELMDDRTVLVVASSMGQKPYMSRRYREGRLVVRFESIEALLQLVGEQGIAEAHPVMTPEWNLTIPDADRRAEVARALRSAYREGSTDEERAAFGVTETGIVLTISPKGLSRPQPSLRVVFPQLDRNGREASCGFSELFTIDAPTPKEGMHDPAGVLLCYGSGVAAGRDLGELSTLDVVPTLLALLGLDVPSHLPGRVLDQLWSDDIRGRAAGVAAAAPLAAVAH